MVATNPRRIEGSWDEGWALDIHTVSSVYIGDNQFGHAQFDTTRSPLGELLYQLKYKQDAATVKEIAQTVATFYRGWQPRADMLVPVPPSRARPNQPVAIVGETVANEIGLPFQATAVTRTKDLPELKNVFVQAERAALLEDAHAVDANLVKGKRVLLFDDLFRSGATLKSITKVLREAGAEGVFALTLTWARSKQ